MKLNIRRVGLFLLLILLSVGFGFGFDAIATAVEKNQYPIKEEYRASIEAYAKEFEIPEAVLWATVCTESRFVSNARAEDGSIGLMQLTPEEFSMIQTEILRTSSLDPGMLYDPDTNLRSGAAYLAHLYQKYGVWSTVFAAYAVGEETVDAWMDTPEYVGEYGTLITIPDPDVSARVSKTEKALSFYRSLYGLS